MPAEAEVIDVPDEIASTRIPDAEVARQQQHTANAPTSNDQIVQAPDPGEAFNTMKDKLDSLLKEARQPAAKEPVHKETPPKEIKETPPKDTPEPAKPADPVDDDKTFTSAKAADWKKLKEAIKERETKLAEWQTKYAAKEKEVAEIATRLKAEDKTPEYQKQIDEWKAKHDTLNKQIETIALERSEPFVQHFNERFSKAITKAKDAVPADKAEYVEQLLNVPPSKWRKEQLNAIREELSGIDQGQLDIAIANMDEARTARETQLKDSKLNLERANGMASEQHNRDRELAKARTETFINRTLDMARNYDSFKPGENDPEQALLAKTNEDRVAKFFRNELPPEEIAIMPIVAAEGKRLIEKVLPALQKENAELREALKAHQVAKPAPEGGKKGAQEARPKTFSEVFQENWPG